MIRAVSALDRRVPAVIWALSVLGSVYSQAQGTALGQIASTSLVPAATIHLAFLLPAPTTLARLAPVVIGVPYVVCASLGVRALASGGAYVSVMSVLGLAWKFVAVVCLMTLATRLAYASLWAPVRTLRLYARVLLVGVGISIVGATAALVVDRPIGYLAGLAVPLSMLMALPWTRATRRMTTEAPMSEGPLSLEQTARGIAHAMQKPVQVTEQRLNGIMPLIEAGEIREEIERATELMAQIQRMVRDLLDLARGGSEHAPRRPLDLDKIVEQAAQEVTGRFPEARIEQGIGPLRVVGDEVALRQLFVNLIENAVEAGGPESVVRLGADRAESWAQISVDDESGGISGNLPGDPFDAFVSSKRRGTGLGLAIVREIAAGHGGRAVAIPLELGTRFLITLPITL